MEKLLRTLLAGLLLAPACESGTTMLRADTTAYLEKMAAWSSVEAETARALDRIIVTNFVDEPEVLRQIADSSPRVRRHLAEAEGFRPRTAEIRRIHDVYLAAWRGLIQGFSSIEEGFAVADQARLSAGRDALFRWRQSIRRVAQDLRDTSERLALQRDQHDGLPRTAAPPK